METHFSLAQLADPALQEANDILRTCVHCGFCASACPTYRILGDERDSPRGRIYLIKGMLEETLPLTEDVVSPIDRCLSCMACLNACPSGVDYMHLIDQGRAHIERHHRRRFRDRAMRWFLGWTLPSAMRLRMVLKLALLFVPLLRIMPARGIFRRLKAMARLMPEVLPPRSAFTRPQVIAAEGPAKLRVAVLAGCVQSVIDPAIHDATVRYLVRHNVDVVIAPGSDCCGSLNQHMGHMGKARMRARAVIDGLRAEVERGLDAVLLTASGCGTTFKDYGHLLRDDAAYADKATRIAALARDISEFITLHDLPTGRAPENLRLACQTPCSLRHGQGLADQGQMLLALAGFDAQKLAEDEICCGSAGTYNILQTELSDQLRANKIRHIEALAPDAVASGNIGCLRQIASGTLLPAVHVIELLDWATGGPKPEKLA